MARLTSPRRLVALGTLVLGTGGLLAFEHTASAAPGGVEGKPAAVTSPTAKKVAKPSANNSANNKSGRHARHCNDGRGKDGLKNKHCRPASG